MSDIRGRRTLYLLGWLIGWAFSARLLGDLVEWDGPTTAFLLSISTVIIGLLVAITYLADALYEARKEQRETTEASE